MIQEVNKLVQAQLNSMSTLYVSTVTGQQVWDMYLNSFPNSIFRDPASSTYNCNHCKNFIRRYGNIISLDEHLNLVTIWDIDLPEDHEYKFACRNMSTLLKTGEIKDVFIETFAELQTLPYESCKRTNEVFRLGVAQNHKEYSVEEANKYGGVTLGKIYQFNHWHLDIAKAHIDFVGKSQEAIQGFHRDNRNVFLRGMREIPMDTLVLVMDLIQQGSLLNAEAHLMKVRKFAQLKAEFDRITDTVLQDRWTWLVSREPLNIPKFKNELIGVLCSELAEGEELNKACLNWNKRADSANYMKAVAPVTEGMRKDAQKKYYKLGYQDSDLDRRFATIDDIIVEEILHTNAGTGTVKTASVFDKVASATPSRHKRSQFDAVEQVSIDKFMKDILPSVSSMEVFLENEHASKLVALTTSNVPQSKNIFKWSNPFSWTFANNLAGESMIKQAVKGYGGKVDGVLRFSIMWADGDGDNSDLDAHCREPTGHIYFMAKTSYASGGTLDVDIQTPNGKLAVENITWPTLSRMHNGDYAFSVHQYAARRSQGFKAEIEFNGEVYQYEYPKGINGTVNVATVSLKNGEFTIQHHLQETTSAKTLWNLDTNQFHKVNLVCLSPNHWGTNNVGNKHYLFMLEGCKSDVSLRGFHNENLNGELLEHRKVMDILGGSCMLDPTDKQLCGVGFNSTIKDQSIIVKLNGSHKRVVKIVF